MMALLLVADSNGGMVADNILGGVGNVDSSGSGGHVSMTDARCVSEVAGSTAQVDSNKGYVHADMTGNIDDSLGAYEAVHGEPHGKKMMTPLVMKKRMLLLCSHYRQ